MAAGVSKTRNGIIYANVGLASSDGTAKTVSILSDFGRTNDDPVYNTRKSLFVTLNVVLASLHAT